MNGFENSLRDCYFSWLNSCLLAGVCRPPLLNTPRVILKKACCTASSPNNLKRSSPDNMSVTTQSPDLSSGNSAPSWTVEFWLEVSCAFVANPAGTTGWLLFRVKEGFGVRRVVDDA